MERVCELQPTNKAVYDRNFEVYVQLYKSNRQLFQSLNKDATQKRPVSVQLSAISIEFMGRGRD